GAARRDHPGGEHAGGGGLARPVGPEEAEDLALVHVEVEVVDRPHPARVDLGETTGLDDGRPDGGGVRAGERMRRGHAGSSLVTSPRANWKRVSSARARTTCSSSDSRARSWASPCSITAPSSSRRSWPAGV